jgi:2-deoxy-D-gluconate 3-dehydrogenase
MFQVFRQNLQRKLQGRITLNIPTIRLDGKVALITGSSSGLGLAVAEGLATYGADIILTEITSKLGQAETAARNLATRTGRKIIALPLDLPDLASIDRLVSGAVTQMGKIDILINNAGVQHAKDALEVTEADWDAILDTHLKGTFFTSQRVAKEMLKQKSGRIINMASQLGLVGYYQRAPYSAAKAGIVNLTRALAVEWARYGINVNAVAPTFIRTALSTQAFSDPKMYNDIVSRIPLGRVGLPEEIIGPMLFLASDASTLVTGHTLTADGGWTAM